MNQQFVTEALVNARDLIEAQNREIAELKRINSAMASASTFLQRYALAVNAHNMKCDMECNAGASCGYEGYLRRTGRRCESCPAVFKIDVMPRKGSA